MNLIGEYQNGNYNVRIYDDGTKVRETDDDKFISVYPECMDVKITNYCDINCPYCFPIGTKILMSDYSLRNIEDIQESDIIIGFEEFPTKMKRKIKISIVKKVFNNISNLIQITTELNSTINCTPNHPFLVKGHGKALNKFDYKIADKLKVGDSLYKIPYFFTDESDFNDDYKKGYITSCFLGDGTYKKYIDKNGYDAYNIRFAVKDGEISKRLFEFVKLYNNYFYELPFKMGKNENSIISIRSNKRDCYSFICDLIKDNYKILKSKEYASGFLAGIYDCEGSINKTCIRICNCNIEIIDEIKRCLNILNINYVLDIDKSGTINYKEKYNIRIKDKREWIKFIQLVKPACFRKGIQNVFEKSLLFSEKITNIEYIDDVVNVYNLETSTSTFFANNFAVHNCHENSNVKGLHGDILQPKFINTLKPFTEIAIGGGNPLSHPLLLEFLQLLTRKNIIPNITVNQKHFLQNQELIKGLIKNNLVYGVGVSLVKVTDELISCLRDFPNVVLHIINGIIKIEDLRLLYKNNFKVLILGYKQFRRGVQYYSEQVEINKKIIYNNLPEIIKGFKVVSFDNLSIKQLDVKRLMSQKSWDEFYMGDDGQFTMYIDLVEQKYARCSVSDIRYDLTDNIEEMFAVIKNE